MEQENKYRNRIWTIPNILSFFRLCLVPIIVWLYCFQKEYMWTAVVLLISGASDIADGFIARHFGMSSELGKALDPVADKMTQGITFFCLFTRWHAMIILPLLMVGKEVVMGITGFLARESTGKFHGAEWHGKLNTVLFYITIFTHVVWPDIPIGISNTSIAVCAVMMLLSLLLYGIRNVRLIKEGTKEHIEK